MPLVMLECLDYDACYAYAPPSVDVLINPDHVTDVRPCDARGIGPFARIVLVDKRSYVARGTVAQVWEKLQPDKIL